MAFMYGSICIDDLPASRIQEVRLKDGRVKRYLRITVGKRREPYKGYDHYVSCRPPRGQEVAGEKYEIGSLKEWVGQGEGDIGKASNSTDMKKPAEQAPQVAKPSKKHTSIDDLPF